jgi:hypothetical protein
VNGYIGSCCIDDSYTAQAIIITDRDYNQITAFRPGAMHQCSEGEKGDGAVARHWRDCTARLMGRRPRRCIR